jgi:hypothetical protein
MKVGGFNSDAFVLFIAVVFIVCSAVAFWMHKGKGKQKYVAMRRNGTSPASAPPAGQAGSPSIVRAMDVLKLSKQDEAKRQRAIKWIESGKVKEGARLFEELGLQRQAISSLEQAGFIEDACAILMRMNRPNRAGVLYQRNGRPLRAAEHFLIANLPEEAAKSFMDAGKEDPNCFRKAADIYEGLGRFDAALDCYQKGDLMEAFVAFCLKHGNYLRLRDVMQDSRYTRLGFGLLDMHSTKKLIKNLPVDSQTAQSLALWCRTVKRVELIEMALRKLTEDRALLTLFWSLLPEEFSAQIVSSLLSAPQFKSDEAKPFLLLNARALYDTKRLSHAAPLYQHTGRLIMAAKCQASLGDLGFALDLLQQPGGDEVLASQLKTLLSPFTDAPTALHARYSPDIVGAGMKILEAVDPDGDELHTKSPFSLTA